MTKKKVLIADDEPDIVELIKYNLELEGLECMVASDGMDALAKARNNAPDLIILDVMLPKMNGYKVARLLRFDERYKGIPIVMVTARTQKNDRITGGESGADEYVGKPFDMDQLTGLVKKHLAP
jgi:DNA-binding response OmpR family regulator